MAMAALQDSVDGKSTELATLSTRQPLSNHNGIMASCLESGQARRSCQCGTDASPRGIIAAIIIGTKDSKNCHH